MTEQTAIWRKSSYSGNSGNCVEVANLGHAVAVRDSKDPNGPKLILTLDGWLTFARSMTTGTYDP